MIASLLVGAVHVQKVVNARSENPYEVAQKQTVLIQSESGQGSGVVIQRGNRLFVWTANHVVDTVDTVTVKQFIRYEGHRAGDVEFKARLLKRSVEKDLALFWLDAPVGYFRPAQFELETPTVGTPLVHVGNVLGSLFDGSISSGIVSQIGVRPQGVMGWPWSEVNLDCATCAAFYGCSGGPVFKQDSGKVLGIIVGSATVGQGYINYVPTREIRDFANRTGTFWAVSGSYCPSDDALETLVMFSRVPKETVVVLDFSVGPPPAP